MQRWAPSPLICALRAFEGEKKVVAPVCFIANASVTSKGTLRTFRDARLTLSGGLRLGGGATPSFLGRFSCFFPTTVMPVRQVCVCAL